MSTDILRHAARPTGHSKWIRLGLAVAFSGASLLALDSTAQAANRDSQQPSHSSRSSAHALTAAICKKVSAASVSKIVGHKVPHPSYSSMTDPATSKDSYISGVTGTCEYGSDANEPLLVKDVFLVVEITSKPYTAAELKAEVEASEDSTKSLHFTISSYAGLGTSAYYFTLTGNGFFGQGISSVSGTTFFGASVETKSLSSVKLGALAKLAEKL